MSDTETRVSEGMLLVLRNERQNLPLRYEWWVVKSTRELKNGDVKVTVLNGTESLSAVGTATFRGGVVSDPWRIVKLSQSDWQTVWEGRAS